MKKDCGEAGCAEGACGTASCLPSSNAMPHKLPIPPAQAEITDVCYVEGWNGACDAFFGGKAPIDPVVIEIETKPAPVGLEPLTIREIAHLTEPWAHIRSDYSIGIARAVEGALKAKLGEQHALQTFHTPTAPTTSDVEQAVRDTQEIRARSAENDPGEAQDQTPQANGGSAGLEAGSVGHAVRSDTAVLNEQDDEESYAEGVFVDWLDGIGASDDAKCVLDTLLGAGLSAKTAGLIRTLLAGATLPTNKYVQFVPDQCDHILWRNNYYALPINQLVGTRSAA